MKFCSYLSSSNKNENKAIYNIYSLYSGVIHIEPKLDNESCNRILFRGLLVAKKGENFGGSCHQ